MPLLETVIDPEERVIDLGELKAQLLIIGEVAAVTSAAFAIGWTVGFYTVWREQQRHHGAAEGEILPNFDNTDFPFLAGNGPWDKDRAAIHMADSIGICAVPLYANTICFVFS